MQPAPGPVLLLALAAALCVNRFALFPTEHASTAEAAVLVAAVVGFRDDAVYLGPLLLGRSFVRGLFVVHVSPQPPIGARGFDPQKTCVPSIPMICTSTAFITIDFAVAVPTPTGPPDALYP